MRMIIKTKIKTKKERKYKRSLSSMKRKFMLNLMKTIHLLKFPKHLSKTLTMTTKSLMMRQKSQNNELVT
jgi:hypothetical protein